MRNNLSQIKIFLFLNNKSYYVKIDLQIGSPTESKLHIAVVGGLYSTEPAGRELALRIARHLYSGFKMNDGNIKYLMKEAVIHIVPVVDDIVVTKCYNVNERNNQVVSSITDPSIMSQRASDFLDMVTDERYDIILSIEGGGLGLRYVNIFLVDFRYLYSNLFPHRTQIS